MSRELRLFTDFWNDVPSLFGKGEDEFLKIMNGKCDFEEHDDRYALELEVPGVKKEEISLEISNDVLTVSWSRKKEKKSGIGKNSRFERSRGNFSRSFSVRGADSDRITASLKNGLLSVELPKTNLYRAKRIEIK